MTTNSASFSDLADRDLLATVHQLAVDERHATTRLIASLAELDARRPHPATPLTDLATPTSASNSRTPGREAKPAVVKPVDAERYKVQFTVTRETLEKLRCVQDLMRHTCCAFVGRRGRCTERGFLEFHHVLPFADGGAAVVENIQLRCRAHNQYESEQWFRAAHPVVVRERPDYSGWIFTRSGPS